MLSLECFFAVAAEDFVLRLAAVRLRETCCVPFQQRSTSGNVRATYLFEIKTNKREQLKSCSKVIESNSDYFEAFFEGNYK